MVSLVLVLADRDKEYTGALAEYITENYAHVFSVLSFMEDKLLQEYLTNISMRNHILLLSGEFWADDRDNRQGGVYLLLAEEEGISLPRGVLASVLKYQSGEAIVSRVLEAYSRVYPQEAFLPDGRKKTRVIAVFSAAGGTGKTTLAVGACMQAAWMGKEVFYLNLESFPSTRLYFEGENRPGLSSVMFYLREKPAVLPTRVAEAVCREPDYQISFFQPLCSVLEFNEEMEEPLGRLLEQLVQGGQYDLIFVDLASCLNRTALVAFAASDNIWVVETSEPLVLLKTRELFREFTNLQARGRPLLEKTTLITNMEERFPDPGSEEGGRPLRNRVKIPRVPGLSYERGNKHRLDLNSPFGEALYELLWDLDRERK